MPIQLEIGYFNTFIISNSTDGDPDIIDGTWYVEESRIKGKYNGVQVDYGVRAYATDEEYEPENISNGLIYSGLYNEKTGINQTNAFPTGTEITRQVDPKYGSIQKLYAEDGDLNIFQESKVHRALIDKDAIYTATGSELLTATSKVIGSITPYLADNGISKNPESHTYNNGRQYFVDKDRGSILRLSRDGITEISSYGLEQFTRDTLNSISSDNAVFIRGMYDYKRAEYVVCISNRNEVYSNISIGRKFNTTTNEEEEMKFATLGFYETNNGWTSFYSYKPRFGFSYKGNFYTYNEYNLYKHYSENVPRCNFYGDGNDSAYIQLVINDNPSQVKNFLTVNYEGLQGWSAININSESHGVVDDLVSEYQDTEELAFDIPKYGTFTNDENGIGINIGFQKKEGEFDAGIISKNNDFYHDYEYSHTSGLKGHYLDLTMITRNTSGLIASQEGPISLFTVSSEAKISST
jgi:hypothetical protein